MFVRSILSVCCRSPTSSVSSSLPTFTAPPTAHSEGLSDADTDMEVDVESIVTSSRFAISSSPQRARNQSKSSATRFNQSGSSSSRFGVRSSQLGRRSSRTSQSRLSESLLLTAEVADGVFEGSAADVEVRFSSEKDESNAGGAADLLHSTRTISGSTCSTSNNCIVSNSPSLLEPMEVDDLDSLLSWSGSNRHSPPRRRGWPTRASLSSPPHQHSSQFSVQPSSKFVTLDSGNNSSSSASFRLVSINSNCQSNSYFPTVSPSPASTDLITFSSSSSPSSLLIPSSCSSHTPSSLPLSVHTGTARGTTPSSSSLPLSSLSTTTTATSSSCTLSNQSSNFVVSNSPSYSSTTTNATNARPLSCGLSSNSGNVFFPSNVAAASGLESVADSILTNTTTSDSNYNSEHSGTCLVNSVDSANKFTSNNIINNSNNSSSPVVSSLLHSQMTTKNKNNALHSNANSIFSLKSKNNSSGHEVVYLNARSSSNNNGNSVVLTGAPSLRSQNKLSLMARSTSDVTSVSASTKTNIISSNNSTGGNTNSSSSNKTSINNIDVINNSSNITNGPSSKNNILVNKTSSSSNSSSTTTPIVKCAKLDHFLFRDS